MSHPTATPVSDGDAPPAPSASHADAGGVTVWLPASESVSDRRSMLDHLFAERRDLEDRLHNLRCDLAYLVGRYADGSVPVADLKAALDRTKAT